jgi:hypothetical protein
MLLNEMQQQQQKIATQANINATQASQLRDVQRQLVVLQAALAKLQPKDDLLAHR